MGRASNLLPLVCVSTVLTSCGTMRTNYTRPTVNVPERYAHSDDTAKGALDGWWKGFDDSNLNTLIDEALKENNDLALAALNVRAVQLQMHLAVINPTVAAGYTDDVTRPLTGSAPTTRFHSLTASVGYEIDLWGQLQATRDAAAWELRATEQDRQSAAMILIGTTIDLYYQLAALNYQIMQGEAGIASARQSFEIVNIQVGAGAASKLEIAAVQQNLAAQQAAQASLVEQRVEARNALTVLLNGTALPESAERLAIPLSPPPAVASDLPASLLGRRPDLRAAELRLRETLAQADAARLSFYPNLSLTGSLGTASTGVAELISNPLESVAIAISAPFIQINEAKFTSELARIQYKKAVLNFRKTLSQALVDVDNALSARTQLALEGRRLEQALEATKITERLTEVRYRAGAVALQQWLDAQAARRVADIALVVNRLNRMRNHVTLCQALGGDATSRPDYLWQALSKKAKHRVPSSQASDIWQ
jgi:NodT family efflux transporter outer membrane factor (OMF) lipoprotein